jgi:hypothetical protein
MNASWKSIAGSMILGAIIAFALGGVCIYEAKQYDALAPHESTATAHLNIRYQYNRDRRSWRPKCDYSFSVEGTTYRGSENCPRQSADNPLKGEILDFSGVLLNSSATVYYDPSDPSTNSLTEYGAKSEISYLYAKLSFGVGAMLVFLIVLGALLVPSANTESGSNGKSGGIVVDAEGTVIYPDAMNSGQPEEPHYSYQDVSTEERLDRSAND